MKGLQVNKLFVVLLLFSPFIWAEEYDDDCRRGHRQCGHDDIIGSSSEQVQDQDQNQDQDQSQSQSSTSSAVNTGNEQSIAFNETRQVPSIYLHQTNQVEACGRVFGISGANTSGAWALGVPIPRSWTPTCDLWKAAEEAQQNSHVFTAYMFMCSIKTIRKNWGNEICMEFDHLSLVELGLIDVSPDLGEIYDRAAKYDERWLMADITQEEYEEQQKQIEYRIAQQQNKIDSLEDELDSRESKIKEFEELKEKQEIHKVEEAEKAAAFNKIYEKIVEQEIEDDL